MIFKPFLQPRQKDINPREPLSAKRNYTPIGVIVVVVVVIVVVIIAANTNAVAK